MPDLRRALLVCLVAPGLQAQTPPVTVTVDARIVLIDREEATRAGVRWLQAGNGRIVLTSGPRRGGGVRVSKEGGAIPVSAFVELAREHRLVRSDSRLQVSTLSGREARIASGVLSTDAWGGAREMGPELVVLPTVLPDGSVRLDVRARLRDERSDPYSGGVSGAPVDVATTVIVQPGAEATVATVGVTEQHRDAALLRWVSGRIARDALVVLRVAVR